VPPTFGRYELLKRLAGGGMGEVYLARHRGAAGFQKLLVIKTLLPHLCEDEEFIHMFQDEARISAQLIHPNICQTFEFDQIDGAWYIAMEYLRGEDVRRLWKAATVKGMSVPVPLICRIIADAAAGLDFAHALKDEHGEPYGIVHRDISPQNILVTFEGGVKVIDFGVAKAQGRMTHTRTGALKGKYSYMSPEQVNGEPVDSRTDIFALGIVLHELLTSLRLFKAESDVSTIERVKKAPIPAPSQLNPSLPKGLDGIVLTALERDVSKRYQTAQQFRLALEDWLVQERMSASSAHLAEFLKQVYRERLEAESKHGPLLGEAEPQAVPIGGRRPISGASQPGALAAPHAAQPAGLPFPLEPQASPAQAREGGAATRNERTPSRQTNPGSASGKSDVPPDDPSRAPTETGPGGPRAQRLMVGIAVAAAVGALSIAMLWPRAKEQAATAASAAVAVVSVVSDPPGAAISIDGKPLGVAPLEARLPAGKPVRVDAALDGYVPALRSVELPAGPQRLELKLQRAGPQLVSLLVKSDPEGAEVSDGARILGHTPFNWTAPKGETRTLTFRLAGYKDLEQRVTATGAEPDLSVRLSRVEGARPASQRAEQPADEIKMER
jgi:serine/threonine protein kinase